MRISTFNLARCKPGRSNRAESLRRIMSEIYADVFVLTESFLAFSPGDGYELIAYTITAPDRTPEERWACIWSRIGGESVPTIASLDLLCLTGGEHDPLALVPGLACIDHICVSQHLQSSTSTPSRLHPLPGTLDTRITDHYASVVDVG